MRTCSLVITHTNYTENWLCLRGPAAASREFPGPELFCCMTHQATRQGPELKLNSWWCCLEHVLHNWCSVESPSLPTTRNGKLPTEPKGVRAEPWKWEATVVNKTRGHCLFHGTTELQLSKEAAATPCGASHRLPPHSHVCSMCQGLEAAPFSMMLEQTGDVGSTRTPMFCRFPGLKQLQLNTSFSPSSEKHLLLVTKGLGMAYCVIA